MSKKTFMAAIIISALSISLVAGMQTVKVIEANPFLIFHQIDPVPGTIPPDIIMFSPLNNTVYSSDDVSVSFKVSKPQLAACDSSIIDIRYTMDDKFTQLYSMWNGGSTSTQYGKIVGIPEYKTTFTLPTLPAGNHQLIVTAEGVVYAGNMSIFYIYDSSTVSFIIAQQPSFLGSDLPTWLGNVIIAVLVIIIIGIISLVYLIRTKKQKEKVAR